MIGKNNLKVSVIIPTLNREKELVRTISDLLNQDYKNFEILIIDQTERHKKDTQNFLHNLSRKNKIKWIRVRKKNLPHARNLGFKNSKGEIILFVDDDVRIKDDFIRLHVESYGDKNIDCVAGGIIEKHRQQYKRSKVPAKISYLGYYFWNFSSPYKTFSETMQGCNMSFRREVFQKIGGFDERFLKNALWEDVDFSLRARKAGYKILFNPKAKLRHLLTISGGCRKDNNEPGWYYYFYYNSFLFYFKHFNFLRSWLAVFWGPTSKEFLKSILKTFFRFKRWRFLAFPIWLKAIINAQKALKENYEN